jgi:hypothetical protein
MYIHGVKYFALLTVTERQLLSDKKARLCIVNSRACTFITTYICTYVCNVNFRIRLGDRSAGFESTQGIFFMEYKATPLCTQIYFMHCLCDVHWEIKTFALFYDTILRQPSPFSRDVSKTQTTFPTRRFILPTVQLKSSSHQRDASLHWQQNGRVARWYNFIPNVLGM